MLRSTAAVVGGLVAAVLVIAGLEAIGHTVYPPPPGIDLHNPESLKTIIDQLPIGAIVMVLVAWGSGTLIGGFTAGTIAGQAHVGHGLVVGGVVMAFAVLTMVMIPHPLWFMVASSFVVLPPALGGAMLAKMLFHRSGSGGPQPYDMRSKNMAC
jgi:hypothetical protein